MDNIKRKKLEAKGWRVGGAENFLGLTKEESEYIELKIKAGKNLSNLRKQEGLTQTQLAKKIGSSQSRIAKMEKGEITVVDILSEKGGELKIFNPFKNSDFNCSAPCRLNDNILAIHTQPGQKIWLKK